MAGLFLIIIKSNWKSFTDRQKNGHLTFVYVYYTAENNFSYFFYILLFVCFYRFYLTVLCQIYHRMRKYWEYGNAYKRPTILTQYEDIENKWSFFCVAYFSTIYFSSFIIFFLSVINQVSFLSCLKGKYVKKIDSGLYVECGGFGWFFISCSYFFTMVNGHCIVVKGNW